MERGFLSVWLHHHRSLPPLLLIFAKRERRRSRELGFLILQSLRIQETKKKKKKTTIHTKTTWFHWSGYYGDEDELGFYLPWPNRWTYFASHAVQTPHRARGSIYLFLSFDFSCFPLEKFHLLPPLLRICSRFDFWSFELPDPMQIDSILDFGRGWKCFHSSFSCSFRFSMRFERFDLPFCDFGWD